MQAYSDPARETDPYALPDVEVFKVPEEYDPESLDGTCFFQGWYWWSCFPDCLPDGEPNGPSFSD